MGQHKRQQIFHMTEWRNNDSNEITRFCVFHGCVFDGVFLDSFRKCVIADFGTVDCFGSYCCLYSSINKSWLRQYYRVSPLLACIFRFNSFETQRETQQKRMRKCKRSLFISFARYTVHINFFSHS